MFVEGIESTLMMSTESWIKLLNHYICIPEMNITLTLIILELNIKNIICLRIHIINRDPNYVELSITTEK